MYQRILGTPFVYNHVRPMAVGGIDMTPFYERVAAAADDVVLDVGCGTGDALRYLNGVARYEGIDTDDVAINFARKRYGDRPQVSFHCQLCTAEDVARIQPSRVLLCGLLHHLSDEEVLTLLASFKASPVLKRIVTSDIVYLERSAISNLLASMDRGRYCRRREQYEALVAKTGLRVLESTVIRCHPKHGLAKYLLMTIEP
ncbi:MAG TPA: class I SAM-dependent methyltransferase [Polyangiaceae bacterium]